MEMQTLSTSNHIENNYRQPGRVRILRDLSPTTREVLRMMSTLEAEESSCMIRLD